MSNTIQIKRSTTAAAVPTAGQLAVGELAVNLVDKKLFTKDALGAVVQIGGGDIASTAESQAGTDNTKFITPLRMREGFNASGSAPVFAARAWVNFNGTGTVAIRASGNVSSITDNGTGNYTLNFTTAMPDANYAVSGTGGRPTSNTMAYVSTSDSASALTTTSVSVIVLSDAAVFRDASDIFIAVFR